MSSSSKEEVIKEILDHTKNQKESQGILSSEQIQHMLNVLERPDIKIMTEREYFKLASHFREPKYAILFHENKNSHVGHWLASRTDKRGVIHIDDSFGRPPVMDLHNRVIKYDRRKEQHPLSTSCGYYALLTLLTDGSMKCEPFY